MALLMSHIHVLYYNEDILKRKETKDESTTITYCRTVRRIRMLTVFSFELPDFVTIHLNFWQLNTFAFTWLLMRQLLLVLWFVLLGGLVRWCNGVDDNENEDTPVLYKQTNKRNKQNFHLISISNSNFLLNAFRCSLLFSFGLFGDDDEEDDTDYVCLVVFSFKLINVAAYENTTSLKLKINLFYFLLLHFKDWTLLILLRRSRRRRGCQKKQENFRTLPSPIIYAYLCK